jgi:uncharacterized membrane protein (DUF485 family)
VFTELARQVGGIDCAASALVTFRSPLQLDNWTMPVIELTLVVGALACLVHALRWKRATGESLNLVVWCAGLVALFLLEPVTYFPQWFGLEEELGVAFIHNQFSVQFMFNRLPLYIAGMYPAFTYMSYIVVRRSGVFQHCGDLAGAVCVGMAYHVLYEFVDMVGPQLRWWVWNYDVPTGVPRVASVPMMSMQAFAFAVPAGIAFFAVRFASGIRRSRGRVALDVAVVVLCSYVTMTLLLLPGTAVSWLGPPLADTRAWWYWAQMAVALGIAVWALAVTYQARARRHLDSDLSMAEDLRHDRFSVYCAVIYLAVVVVIWGTALPAYFGAQDGLTEGGAPTGSLIYAVACGVLAVAMVYATDRSAITYRESTRPSWSPGTRASGRGPEDP